MVKPVYRRTVAPAVEPVTLAEAKAHCKIDASDEDAYITALITAAREMVCTLTGRSLINETWTATLDAWPAVDALHDWWDGVREGPISQLAASYVELTKAPNVAITSVNLLDEDNAATLWAATGYYLVDNHGYGRLTLRRGQVWPIPLRDAGAIVITFTAGYGASAASVPFALKHAIMLLVSHWFENRMPASECASSKLMPAGLGSILASYRLSR